MAGRFSFESRIVTVLIAVLFIVVATGIFTYIGLKDIVSEVSDAAKPNFKITVLKQVLFDLSDAENSVKSYNLTHDEEYLQPFYKTIASIDERMEDMLGQKWATDEQQQMADSISHLIETKFEILNDLVLLQNSSKITDELKRISQKLAETQRKQDAENKNSKEAKTNIFQKIFGTRDTVKPTPRLNLKEVQREVAKVQEDQARQLQDINKRELDLTRDDKLVTDKIRLLIYKLEAFEKSAMSRKVRQVAQNANNTNLLIGVFCFVATFLLIAVCYVIVSYVQKNKAYRAALKQTNIETENLARAKENFLANMSHEIRTPMNAIAGFTEQVLQTPLKAAQREQLEVVKKSADHLLHIINDILDFSKIQAGKLKLESVGFKPRDVVDEVIFLMLPAAHEKGLAITKQIEKIVPDVLVGDPVRLRQILLNLVSNAIKFTEKGEIAIKLSAVLQGAADTHLQITVEDTGVGIEPNKLKSIFNEFEQADTSISRRFGGTGLGLTITKKLAEMQKGSVDIRSTPGKGTRVICIIPYRIGIKADVKEKEERSPVNRLKRLVGIKALVVDDEPYNRKLINTILKKWGIETAEAQSGREAIEQVKNRNFDIVLMDVRMPEMDGVEASTAIRAMKNKDKAGLPILALTATVNPIDIEACKKAGMQDVVSKPFKELELYEKMVRVLFSDKETISTTDDGPETSANPGESRYNLEELKKLSNGDPAFIKEMTDIFITSTRDGLKKIDEAIMENDWISVANFAHKIIPPCRHLEARHLLTLLKSIETDIREKNDHSRVPILLAQAKIEASEIINELEKDLEITKA